MSLTNKEISTINSFLSKAPVTRAFIFGSYARSEETKDSDIDILVELDYSKHFGLGFIKLKQDIEETLLRNIDLISTESISPHILPFINKDKQLIYERTNK